MTPLWRRPAGEVRELLPVLAAFGCMILSVLLLLSCLYLPNAVPALWDLPQVRRSFPDAPPARMVLEGCQFWYILLMLACALVTAVCLTIAVWTLHRLSRHGVSGPQVVRLYLSVLLLLGMVVFACGALLITEGVPSLFLQTVEDIAQLEEGRTEEAVVWLSPRTWPYRLPGPYADGQPQPLTRYGAIGPDTAGTWEDFYVPDALEFAMDPDRVFDENRSIPWNEAHTQWYRLTYTSNFRLVVAAEPCSGPG